MPTLAGHVRLGLRVAAMTLALAGAVILHGVWRLFRLPSPWPRLLLASIGWLAGARRRSIGTPLRRDVVFVANHLSWVDILVLAGATGTAFVAKAELARVPLVGWLCRRNRTLFVARGDRMGVQRQVEQLRAMLADGWAVAIFPEGTTGGGDELLPFKPALLAALDPPPAGVQLQPVRIDYGAATPDIAWVGDETGASHAARVLRRQGNFTTYLTFLPPFVPEGGRKEIAATARASIVAAAFSPATADLTGRRPVWSALSDLFLDTDFAPSFDYVARTLAASPYSLETLERILIDEVTPVCGPNLYWIAGEWAGFDEQWLEQRILDRIAAGRRGWRSRMMWPEWLALREAVVQRRAGSVAAPAPL